MFEIGKNMNIRWSDLQELYMVRTVYEKSSSNICSSTCSEQPRNYAF